MLRAVRGIDDTANFERAGADRGYALVQQDDASLVALGDAPGKYGIKTFIWLAFLYFIN